MPCHRPVILGSGLAPAEVDVVESVAADGENVEAGCAATVVGCVVETTVVASIESVKEGGKFLNLVCRL